MPTSNDPQNEGLIPKVEWFQYESPHFFVPVFCHGGIYVKSILLCGTYSSTALKFHVKRTRENQTPSQDPDYSQGKHQKHHAHICTSLETEIFFFLGVWHSRRWQQRHTRFSLSVLKIVVKRVRLPMEWLSTDIRTTGSDKTAPRNGNGVRL